jgi:hypothetical protein
MMSTVFGEAGITLPRWKEKDTTMATRSTPVKQLRKRRHHMPEAGSEIIKLDRNGKVRCKCFVNEDGTIRFASKNYGSLSAAATAACEKLGLTTKTINGWTFWGLQKTAAPAKAAKKAPAAKKAG